MSPSSFMLVLAIMWVPVIAIYVTLFSVGWVQASGTRLTKRRRLSLQPKSEAKRFRDTVFSPHWPWYRVTKRTGRTHALSR
jgi:hypothetical protein